MRGAVDVLLQWAEGEEWGPRQKSVRVPVLTACGSHLCSREMGLGRQRGSQGCPLLRAGEKTSEIRLAPGETPKMLGEESGE